MYEFGPAEQSELLALARRALECYFQTNSVLDHPPQHPVLNEPMRVFVSLHRKGSLRGCLGRVQADRALYRNVVELALAAALEDPRFLPVQVEELPELDIEISILSSFERVRWPEEIEVGRHGLRVSMGSSQGLFLPQVAAQQGWDPVRFFEETCRKAGLPKDCWRHGAVVEKFSAQVFGEHESGADR